jgi:LPXTG-site transpeptidase (sortase) family protein
MKTFFDFFSPGGSNRYAAAAILVLAAAVLWLLAFGVRFNLRDIEKILPRPMDLATSPLVRDIAQSQEPQSSIVAEQNSSSTKTGQIDYKEITDNASQDIVAAKPAAVVPTAPATAPDAQKSDMVVIPKIGVSAPIITPQTNDAVLLKKLLDSGAVIYPDSAMIGAAGQTILLGHSAPANWPKIKHDTIFSDIIDLVAGDKVIAIYNDRTYNYTVLQSQIIERGGDIPAIAQSSSSLVLVTCWPPGRNLKRLVVEAQLDSVE